MNNEQVAASFHDGQQDENCTFHGNHLHLVQKLNTNEQHIQHHYSYKKLKKKTDQVPRGDKPESSTSTGNG